MRKKGIIVISVLVGVLFFVVGVPVIINECYKVGGYITLWNANDVLAYYGTILGATVSVVVLATTILFTRKQILHDQYARSQAEQWKKVDGILSQTIEAVEPLIVVQMVYSDTGYKHASETSVKLQNHIMKTKASLDMLECHIDDAEFIRVMELIRDVVSCMDEVEKLSKQFSEQLMRKQEMDLRNNYEQLLQKSLQSPGLVDAETIQSYRDYLSENPPISMNEITKEIGEIGLRLVDLHNKTYHSLLSKKRDVFRQIEKENTEKANNMLNWFSERGE